jgi:peptidoglycan/xylan/chitin deacetylase (PgdA/CDA1 family)
LSALVAPLRSAGYRRPCSGCALALERNPAVAAAIRESGWDVCSHGWRGVKHYELTEAQEREHIRMAVESMKKTVGETSLGTG